MLQGDINQWFPRKVAWIALVALRVGHTQLSGTSIGRLAANWLLEAPILVASARILVLPIRIALALYWIAIFAGTHLPKSSMPSLAASDKLYHAGAYAVLAGLLFYALPSNWTGKLRGGLVVGVGLTYAIVDELTQNLVPGREADFWDAFADAIGICLALSMVLCFRQMSPQRPNVEQQSD